MPHDPPASPPRHRLRYLALGDSYTIGEGVEAGGSWPMQLARALRDEGIPLGDPQVIATTGWTTDELDAAIDAAAPPDDFDLASLLIGVNNQYRGRGAEEYARQFEGLLERTVGFVGGDPGRAFVLSIPDWGVTPFAAASGRDVGAIGRELDAFNAIAARQCGLRGVAFVDITPASRAHGAQPRMLAGDGLHPSAAMYEKWAELALPVARRLLQRGQK